MSEIHPRSKKIKWNEELENTLSADLQIIGKNLSALRDAKGLNIESVAKAVKCSSGSLKATEQGVFNFRLELLDRLCEYYGIKLGDLLTKDKYSSCSSSAGKPLPKQTMDYTAQLKEELHWIQRTSTALVSEVPGKSIEQFIAEIEFTKGQLTDLEKLLKSTNSSEKCKSRQQNHRRSNM